MNDPAAVGVVAGNPAAEPGIRVPQEHLPEQPIAIIGMACRFPGADDLGAFWRLLEAGGNAVSEGVPGSGVGRVGELFGDDVDAPACRFGAFVDGIDQFDASFFRISPIEAQLLDPQQRLMLETSWCALEDAGIDPDGLKGSRTGVYAGISNNEYRGLVAEAIETSEPAASLYSVTGTSFNTAATSSSKSRRGTRSSRSTPTRPAGASAISPCRPLWPTLKPTSTARPSRTANGLPPSAAPNDRLPLPQSSCVHSSDLSAARHSTKWRRAGACWNLSQRDRSAPSSHANAAASRPS